MPDGLPQYYTKLAPFRGFFSTGAAILTYHKIAPRPRGARLKGLYLSPALFEKQLGELRLSGFASRALDEIDDHPPNSIILTFDDGFRNVLRFGGPVLAANRFKAIEFLVADRLGKQNEWEIAQGELPEPLMDRSEVREWLAQGHQIGSHTLTHPFLTQIAVDQAREEIRASKHKLEDQFGAAVEHFCYPYGDWNPAVRELVREAGYKTACTTEFGVNQPATCLFELKRITARYASRNWKNLSRGLKRFFGSK